jgi:Coenzyme PQQ synthesis protein D (PqqD)
MNISFDQRVSLPRDVLISNVQDESVILNLDTERYFGLDEVGTRFLSLLSKSDSIQKAYEALLDEYDVEPELLRRDLTGLLTQLVEQGLVQLSDE